MFPPKLFNSESRRLQAAWKHKELETEVCWGKGENRVDMDLLSADEWHLDPQEGFQRGKGTGICWIPDDWALPKSGDK